MSTTTASNPRSLPATEGSVLQRGRRTALAQASLTDEQGRLVAHATSSCMIFS